MNDKARKILHDHPVEEAPGSPFIVRRREITADFDERQKQLFDQALIAILVADLSPDKTETVLAAARETTIQVFGGELLAGMNTPTQCRRDERPTADRTVPSLLFCTSCQGYSLTLRGKLVQCDDCGAVQPVIVDQPRIVSNGVVTQELVARCFPSGELAMAALREEEKAAGRIAGSTSLGTRR